MTITFQKRESLIELVRLMDICIKKIAMYKMEHPATKTALKEGFRSTQKATEEAREIVFSLLEENLLINDVPVDNQFAISIASKFRQREISSIKIVRGVEESEFALFIKILVATHESLKQAGGVQEVFAKRNISHIEINEARYARIEKEETVSHDAVFEIDTSRNNAFALDCGEEIRPQNSFEKNLLQELQKLSDSSIDYQHIFNDILQRVKEEVAAATDNLKTKNREITFEKERTESVIKSLSEGLVVVDETGKVLMVNPAAEKILESRAEEKIGSHILDNIQEHQVVSLSHADFKDDKTSTKEITIQGNHETNKTIRSSMAIVENEHGKTVGMVSVLTDVTKQKELDQLKADFQSKVTHELRAPIATIKQTLSMILKQTAGSINYTQEKFLGTALKSLERLSRLINDLLDLSKMESKKMVLHLKEENVEEMVSYLNFVEIFIFPFL